MRDDVQPGRPRIREQGVEHLAGIENRRLRVAEQWLTAVLSMVPQRPAPGGPLLLHPQVEGIEEVARIAVGQLAVFEQDRSIADHKEGPAAAQANQMRQGAGHDNILGWDPSVASMPERDRPPRPINLTVRVRSGQAASIARSG